MVDAETLRRACKVHPIHTVEMSCSLIDRRIEKELIDTAKELGVKVLAFGTIGHHQSVKQRKNKSHIKMQSVYLV